MDFAGINSLIVVADRIALETGDADQINKVAELKKDVEKLSECSRILTSSIMLLDSMLPKTIEPFEGMSRKDRILAIYNSLTNEGHTVESLEALSPDEALAFSKRVAVAIARRISTANSFSVVA